MRANHILWPTVENLLGDKGGHRKFFSGTDVAGDTFMLVCDVLTH